MEADTEPDKPPRQNLIDTAVRFLQNGKVQGTSLELKKNFLSKKGLTTQEISLALDLVKPSPEHLPVYQSESRIYKTPQTSLSSKLRDALNVLLLIGGFSYGIRYIWKKYLRPWLFGESKETSPEQILLQTSQTLLSTIYSLQEGIIKLQETLERVGQRKHDPEVSDIKKEILSLKGLLLSSRSFPQNPPTVPPSIPSWQLPDSSPDDRKPDVKSPNPTEPDTKDRSSSSGGVGQWDEGSANGSSASEIELLGHDSGSEEGAEKNRVRFIRRRSFRPWFTPSNSIMQGEDSSTKKQMEEDID